MSGRPDGSRPRATGSPTNLAILLREGLHAVIRAEVLTDDVDERLLWLSKDPDGFAHFTGKYVPEGLPDSWIEATGRASWATWYREARDGR